MSLSGKGNKQNFYANHAPPMLYSVNPGGPRLKTVALDEIDRKHLQCVHHQMIGIGDHHLNEILIN